MSAERDALIRRLQMLSNQVGDMTILADLRGESRAEKLRWLKELENDVLSLASEVAKVVVQVGKMTAES